MTIPHIRDAIVKWMVARQELAAMERAEHPDITDQHGRVWVWVRGDLYSHDQTLAVPQRLIPAMGLPPAALAENPNYGGLCGICRSEWPVSA